MPLPPTEGAILHTHSKEGLMPIEEPKGSTIPVEFPFPGAKRTRGKKGGEGKTLRPSTLQKFCKKFDGIGDPYYHVAQYRQLLFAEGITDVHTMVQAFGLTMEGQALAWFQTLKSSVLYDFEVLVKNFIDSYSKIGIKHNIITKFWDSSKKIRRQ